MDENKARINHESNHPVVSIINYLNQLNTSRVDQLTSYGQLNELEKMLFKSQLDVKERVKQEAWKNYLNSRKAFIDANSWLISYISECVDSSYMQFLIDFQDWEATASSNESYKIKIYLRNRAVAISGQVSVKCKHFIAIYFQSVR